MTEEIELLRAIKKRLAPDFNDLDPEIQEALFYNALDRTPLGEVYEIATTDKDLVEAQKRKDRQEHDATILRAKAAGLPVNEQYQTL